MKTTKKRMFTALCGLGMAASILAACGNETSEPAGTGNGDTGGAADATPAPELTGSRIVPEGETLTLRFYNADGAMNPATGQSVVMEEITRRTGIELEVITPMAGHDETTDVPLFISQGNVPDLIFANTATGMLIEHNAIIDLEPFIMSEAGADIRALYGPMLGRLRHSSEDPRIFHAGTTFVDYERLTTSGTAQVQMSVMRYAGFPEISTLDELEELIANYMESHPEINGQPTIGLTLIGSNWRWGITVGNPSKFTSGVTDDGGWAVDETGAATLNWLRPEAREHMRWLNRMNDRGLLDEEWLTQTEDQYFEKIATGRALAVMDQNWSIGSSQAALRDAGLRDGGESHWRMMMPVPVMLEADMVPQVTRPTGWRSMTGVAVSATSEHQEEALRFLNWMASEEAQILMNWGIEGVHYFYDENGVRTFYPEMAEIRDTDNETWQRVFGIGNYVHPFPQLGNTTLDSTGNPITPNTRENHMRTLTDAQRETLAAYGVETFIDLFPSFPPGSEIPHGEAWTIDHGQGTEFDILMSTINPFAEEQVSQMIMVSPDEFDALWDNFVATLLDMGAERAGELKTEYVRDRLNLWSQN